MARMTWTRSALVLLLVLGLARAAGHFIRLALLAALGLAGMYMLHKLAQDYNKIQANRPNRPAVAAGKALLKAVFKRDLDHEMHETEWTLENTLDSETLDKILEEDPRGCARKMVCELATRSPVKLKEDEAAILRFIKHDITGMPEDTATVEFRRAYELGKATRDRFECASTYRKCPFEARTILKLLRAHG